jgi:ketosteroid isomerase-like protein
MAADPENARLLRAVDQIEIREVLTDYPSAIDARDWTRLRAVFTDDAAVRFGDGTPWMRGGDQVVDHIRAETKHLLWQHHHISVYGVELGVDGDPDRAAAQVYLLSHQMLADDPGHVLMMASRYRDDLRRVGGEWKISTVDLEVLLFNYLAVSDAPGAAISDLLDPAVGSPGVQGPSAR